MKKRALIIGGGIGGLFTGALLSKNNIRVTVLEKNSIIGGGLQCFRRGDKIFETGMHIMGGFEEKGNLAKICEYLEILDKLKIHHINHDCMDEIYYKESDETYLIPSGRDAFVNKMTEYFPAESEGIKKYVDEIYRLSQEVPLFYLKEETDDVFLHSEEFVIPADKLIAGYVKDEKLREVLAYLNPLYGGEAGHTPAYIHSLINVLYINGSSRFIGGSQQLADALKDIIVSFGGEVLENKEVSEISVANKEIKGVKTSSGEEYSADWYISSIHPTELVKLLPSGAFLKGFVNRLNEIPVSYSSFSLFIDLKEEEVPYIDHTCYFMEDYGNIWRQHSCDFSQWPLGFMYMTPPEENQGKFASRLLVNCIMSFDEVREWEDTKVGSRGESYSKWKEECISKIIKKLDIVIPDISKKIYKIYASSPLTIRDYFHTKEGAIFGNKKDCENLMLSQLSVYTKIKNLLLTGQNINLHGICGVPLTAINTCEAILGRNFLIKRINEKYENR